MLSDTFDPILAEHFEQTEIVEKDVRAFLLRFKDLNAFLENANIVVQFYFKRQTDYKNIEEYKKFLKKILSKYVQFFDLDEDDMLQAYTHEPDIEEEYDELIYFGVYNPVKARRERLKTGITVGEQDSHTKGLVVDFKNTVKEIL